MTEAIPVETGSAPVNGLQLYYEVRGAGEPLVLLHGGVVGIAMFGPNLAALAEGRKVIAVELQGHGRTPDIDRPLSFEAMADDVAALLKHLGVERADLLGLSLGGGVALQAAIRHPELVRKLVVVSAPFRREGWYQEVRAGFDRMGPAAAGSMAQSPLSQLYPNVDWANLFGKLGDLLRRDYDWSAEVAAIESPVMIVYADADAVSMAHIAEFFGLLGGGEKDAGLDGSGRPAGWLAILPGLTHYNISSAPALAAAVAPFLERAHAGRSVSPGQPGVARPPRLGPPGLDGRPRVLGIGGTRLTTRPRVRPFVEPAGPERGSFPDDSAAARVRAAGLRSGCRQPGQRYQVR